MATLEIKNLHVSIEDKEILKGVNLTINTGEIHAFASFDLHPKKVWAEFVPFVACRAATGAFTMVAMIVMVDGLGIRQDFICKIVVSAISLVLNYIFSKWFIFRKKES